MLRLCCWAWYSNGSWTRDRGRGTDEIVITAKEAHALLPTYDRLRAVGRGLNDALVPMVSKKAKEEAARALGLWERGTIVLRAADQMNVFADYAIHDVRAGGKNAVERFAARSTADVDVQAVLVAMRASRFTLVQVTERLDAAGVVVNDLLYGERLVILDHGLGDTASPGLVLATRLLPFDGWSMTSGTAPLPIDQELAAMFLNGLGDLSFLATAPRALLARLTATMIALAVGDPEETKAEWRRAMARRG